MFDVAGVLLLGYDLIRVQKLLRLQARDDLSRFEAMASDYGGVGSWISEIKESAKWVSQNQFGRYCSDDEVHFNANHALERVYEVSQCVSALAEHLSELLSLQKEQAEGNAKVANKSLRYSFLGLVLIFIGFSLQLFSSVHC